MDFKDKRVLITGSTRGIGRAAAAQFRAHGAMVAINGEVVFISPTGRFSKFITLSEGVNKIRVVARDVQGNETVIERTVTYQK